MIFDAQLGRLDRPRLPAVGGRLPPIEIKKPLQPCPFCGTELRDDEQELGADKWLQMNEIAGPYFNVECFGCGVETGHRDTEEEAVEAWNTRAA